MTSTKSFLPQIISCSLQLSKLNEQPWKSQYVVVKPTLQLQFPLMCEIFKEMFIDAYYNLSYTIFNSNLINWFNKTLQLTLNIYGLLDLASW